MKSLLATLAAAALCLPLAAQAQDSKLFNIPLKDIDGKQTSLKPYAGKVLLVVNVASRCGNTKQYTGLESVYQKYKNQGLVVMGFPANDFGAQEPGTEAEIKEFCTSKYNVTFPMFEKIQVKGPGQHPLYAELTGEKSPFPGPVKWNFGKFLIGRDGKIVARFEPGTKPESPEVIQTIEKTLAAK